MGGDSKVHHHVRPDKSRNRTSALSPFVLGLLGAAARSTASVFQSLIQSVQLVAKVTESDLFRSQLLLGVYFSCLQLLFLAFYRLESCLAPGNNTLKLFPLR